MGSRIHLSQYSHVLYTYYLIKQNILTTIKQSRISHYYHYKHLPSAPLLSSPLDQQLAYPTARPSRLDRKKRL